MSLVSAILFNAPPPIFHGNIRKIVNREMLLKTPKSFSKEKNNRAVDVGRINRAAILRYLDNGKKRMVVDIANAVGLTRDAVRVHLHALSEMNAIKKSGINPGRISRANPFVFWIEK